MAKFLFALALFTLCFAVVERVEPVAPGRRSWRAARVDLLWFLLDEAVRQLARVGIVAVLAAGALLLGMELGHAGLTGFGPLAAQPKAMQAVEVILIVDAMGYLVHRAMHSVPWLWRIHAVHHAPHELDWLAGARVHPLDTLLTRPVRVLPALLLGLDPRVTVATAPFFAFWNLFVHANVRSRRSVLSYLVSTPRFHRWHHAADVPSCNFSPLLPIWDLLGGTFYLPARDAPRTGVDGLDVPSDLLGQVWFPLRASTAPSHAQPPSLPEGTEPLETA